MYSTKFIKTGLYELHCSKLGNVGVAFLYSAGKYAVSFDDPFPLTIKEMEALQETLKQLERIMTKAEAINNFESSEGSDYKDYYCELAEYMLEHCDEEELAGMPDALFTPRAFSAWL